MTGSLLPHDLLRVDSSRIHDALVPDDERMWQEIEGCLGRAPWMVVRRTTARVGYIPVGVRGKTRSQRFAAWLSSAGIREIVTPQSLRVRPHIGDPPALAALYELQQRLGTSGYCWGPAGSCGFQLASGVAMVDSSSDLDLVFRMPARPENDALKDLRARCMELPCAVDIQVETPHGAFALDEYLQSPQKLLLRTCVGPALVRDPWSPGKMGERQA